ncbi:MAG: hypothetical protein R3C49_23585 [Planctomycetaceae bacterium]
MSVRPSVVPKREGDFEQFIRTFVKRMIQDPLAYHITAERAEEYQTGMVNWLDKVDAATVARDAAKAATDAKDEARRSLEELVRTGIRMIQADPGITNEARLEAGLPVHKTTRTPVPPPSTAPTGQVLATERLEQSVMYSDALTPTRRGRPEGVTGCEVYVAVSDTPPSDPKAYRFVGVSTRSPELVTFESEDGGKTANYLLRWINSRGETGPWSQPISATVPAV